MSLPQHVIAILWTYVTETGAGLQHTKRMQQNMAYHQTRVHLVCFFFHLLTKNYRENMASFRMISMGNRYQIYVKNRGRTVCVRHEYKIHSFILFYDAVHDAILSHTPTGYFFKVLQSQVALIVYTWNHSLKM